MIDSSLCGAYIILFRTFLLNSNLKYMVRSKDFSKALQWYEKLICEVHKHDAEGGYDCVLTRLAPRHEILAFQAQIHFEGGHGVTKDPNRAGKVYCYSH